MLGCLEVSRRRKSSHTGKFSYRKELYMDMSISKKNNYLNSNLFQLGISQLSGDQSLFISEELTLLVYIYDTLFYSPITTEIDKTLNRLR